LAIAAVTRAISSSSGGGSGQKVGFLGPFRVNVHTVDDEHMVMQVEIDGPTRSLNECHRPISVRTPMPSAAAISLTAFSVGCV
jgi:hypothetical protein